MGKPTAEEMCREFKLTYTSAVTDIMRDMGRSNQWLGPEIRPFSSEMHVAGPAYTMRFVNDGNPNGEDNNKAVAEMMKGLDRFMVPVLDSNKCARDGYWGEMLCTYCKQRGIDGAVIDGGVRDGYFVYKTGFNMFAAFTCPNSADSRLESFQEPIFINKVRISPGDFIVGDFGGVVVVPQEIVGEVYLKSKEIMKEEDNLRDLIAGGGSYDEVTKGGTRGL